MNIAIWGTGKKCKELLNNLIHCNIVAFVESHPQYDVFNGIKIYTIDQLMEMSFDILIVSVVNAADIETKLYESYPSILHKCVFLFLENIRNVQYFFYQYQLVNNVIYQEYLLKCCEESLTLLRYDYQVMQFRKDLNSQEKDLLDYARKKGYLQKLNYSFTEKYLDCAYNIRKAQNGMYYVRYLEKDVYFPRSWNKKKIICYWCNCMMEDDQESPLKTEMDRGNANGVIIEIGNIIPIWTMKNLDVCKNAYILNTCDEWKEALRLTFKESLHKCSIIDDLSSIMSMEISCCKISDEYNLLHYMNNLLAQCSVHKFIVSVYYHDSDLELVNMVLANRKYDNSITEGYVYYPYNLDTIWDLHFRRGMLIGCKQ